MIPEADQDIRLHFEDTEAVACWRIGVCVEASWAMRPDWSSQGNVMVFFTQVNALTVSLAVPLIVLDWSIRRLERMCRKTAANAVDMLE